MPAPRGRVVTDVLAPEVIDVAVELYTEERWPISEIGRFFGVTHGALIYHFRRKGVQTHPSGTLSPAELERIHSLQRRVEEALSDAQAVDDDWPGECLCGLPGPVDEFGRCAQCQREHREAIRYAVDVEELPDGQSGRTFPGHRGRRIHTRLSKPYQLLYRAIAELDEKPHHPSLSNELQGEHRSGALRAPAA